MQLRNILIFLLFSACSPVYAEPQFYPDGLSGFPDELVERVVAPHSEDSFILQKPVVSQAKIRETLNLLNWNQDFTTQYYLKYGLHPNVTNSYYTDQPKSYVEYDSLTYGPSRMGVTPNCFSCHSGRVDETLMIGLNNSRIDYKTFFRDLSPKNPIKNLHGIVEVVPNLIPTFIEAFKENLSEGEVFNFTDWFKIDDLYLRDWSKLSQNPLKTLLHLNLDLAHQLRNDARAVVEALRNRGKAEELRKTMLKQFLNGTLVLPTQLTERGVMVLDMFRFTNDLEQQSPSAGHSNPWGFAVQLFNWRDNDMNYLSDIKKFNLKGRGLTQDLVVMDPMPWWLLKYKQTINWDGIMRKSPRTIVQAAFSPGNSGAYIRSMEPYFIEIYEAAHRLESPRFPQEKNEYQNDELRAHMVSNGEKIFNKRCDGCHGLHSENGEYFRKPEQFIPHYKEQAYAADKIGVDATRSDAVNLDYIDQLEKSWIGYYGNNSQYIEALQRPQVKDKNPYLNFDTTLDKALAQTHSPVGDYYREREKRGEKNDFAFNYNSYGRFFGNRGYIAPPLWGISLSAPYLHNGSVPNLKQFIGLQPRPTRWMKVKTDTISIPYDYTNVGLALAEESDLPMGDNPQVYDTNIKGQSHLGHEKFFTPLDLDQKRDLLEYLKSL